MSVASGKTGGDPNVDVSINRNACGQAPRGPNRFTKSRITPSNWRLSREIRGNSSLGKLNGRPPARSELADPAHEWPLATFLQFVGEGYARREPS